MHRRGVGPNTGVWLARGPSSGPRAPGNTGSNTRNTSSDGSGGDRGGGGVGGRGFASWFLRTAFAQASRLSPKREQGSGRPHPFEYEQVMPWCSSAPFVRERRGFVVPHASRALVFPPVVHCGSPLTDTTSINPFFLRGSLTLRARPILPLVLAASLPLPPGDAFVAGPRLEALPAPPAAHPRRHPPPLPGKLVHALYGPSSSPFLRVLSRETPHVTSPVSLSVAPTPPLFPVASFCLCVCASQFFSQCAFNAYSLHPWDYRGDREQAQYVPGDFLVHFAGKKGMKKVHLMEHYLTAVERTYGGVAN